MSKFIVRLVDGDEPRYVEWSTVVDAPITYLMTRDELQEFLIEDAVERAREEAIRDWPLRMARVDATGTSAYGRGDADDEISCNRAGPDESHLPTRQAIAEYLREQEQKARS